jgi:GTPase-associated system helical domain
MALSIFDRYQRESLFPSLGGNDDDIYNKLKKAAADIADLLALSPTKIIAYASVAFDNQVNETEPVLEAVENTILNHWKQLRSQFPGMPVALYRAILLLALEQLVARKVEYAIIIWLAVRDAYPFLDIKHKEKGILQAFLHDLGEKTEQLAIEDWTVSKETVQIEMPIFDLTVIKLEKKVESSNIQKGLDTLQPPIYNTSKFQHTEAASKLIADAINSSVQDAYLNGNFTNIKNKISQNFTIKLMIVKNIGCLHN